MTSFYDKWFYTLIATIVQIWLQLYIWNKIIEEKLRKRLDSDLK